MKAWKVGDGDSWCVLVFAATRTRARMVFLRKYDPFNGYIDVRAVRHPALDGMIDHEKLYEMPRDLPEGVKFWPDRTNEEDFDGEYDVGMIHAWGGHSICAISDDVPGAERAEVERLIARAPETLRELKLLEIRCRKIEALLGRK